MTTIVPRASEPSFVEFDRTGRAVDGADRLEAGTATTRVPSRTLVELIGSEALQGIQDAFAIAFDIPTVILDHEGHNVNEITHRVAFCEDFTRPSTAGSQCLDCDRSGIRISSRTRRPTIFTCWNQLHDCTVPIVSSRGEVFGYFLSGQVLTEENLDVQAYRAVAREHGIDEDAYVEAAAKLRVFPLATYARSIECIGVLARMIGDQASAALRHRELLDSLLVAQGQTQRLAGELDEIAAISSQIAGSEDQVAAMHRLADAIERVIPLDSMVIFELQPDSRLHPVMVRDPFASALAQWKPPVGSGLVGTVVKTGAILHLDDVTLDPRFEPIPGVPAEPEALLAVPLQLSGAIIGAIQVSRFQKQIFTEHERDLLKVIASYTAIALGAASLQADTVRYADVTRSQRALREALATGVSVAALLDELARQAQVLFACDRIALRIQQAEGAVSTRLHMTQREQQRFEREHADTIAGAHGSSEPVTVSDGTSTALVVPLQADHRSSGHLICIRQHGFPALEQHLALVFAQQSGMVIESAIAQHRVRSLGARARRLAEIGGAVARAQQRDELTDAVTRAHELVDGRLTMLALSDEMLGGFRVEITKAHGEGRDVRTAGRPELRLPEVRGDSADFEDLFDAWGSAFAQAIGCDADCGGAAAVPVWQGPALAGAIIVIGPAALDRDGRSLLQSVARLVEVALRPTSSDTLPPDTLERHLMRMHESAQRLLTIDDPAQLARTVIEEFVSLSGGDGALLVEVRPGCAPQRIASTGLTRSMQQRLLRALTAGQSATDSSYRKVPEVQCTFELGGGGLLLFAGPPASGPPMLDLRIQTGFVGYAGLALERARELAKARAEAELIERERTDLVEEAARLAAIVETTSRLTDAALSPAGCERMTELLAELLGGDVAIYGTDGLRIAVSNEDNELLAVERLDLCDVSSASHHADPASTGRLVTTPILADGDHMGWIAHVTNSPSATEPAVIASAARASAITLLRARAADEAESRVRGDFVDSLLRVREPSEELIRHGSSLGYDLTQPWRVAVAEIPRAGTTDLYRLAMRWAAHLSDQLLMAERGGELVIVGPSDGRWPEDLHQHLAPLVSVRLGVGPSTVTDGFSGSHSAAMHAARAMGRLGRTGVMRIDDDRLEQLLLRSADPDRLAGFQRRILGPLDDYDREHDSSLRETLELACQCGWNMLAAARAAHVHHSTLRYRLARIAQLTGLDLTEQDGRLAAHLALLVDRLAPS